MKKIKIISFIIVLVLAVSFMAACVSNGTGASIYYGPWEITTEPTCEGAGIETRTAIGDKTKTQSRYIPALGHDFAGNWVVLQPPTADSPGLQKDYCTHGCGEFIQEVIPALGGDGNNNTPETLQSFPAQVIPADQEGVFVLGGYEKFISEEAIYAITKDFELYCSENAIARRFIGYRMYDAGLDVAALSSAVVADADVDALLGGGGNIDSNSAGNLSSVIVKMQDGNTIYNGGKSTDTSRTHITLNNQTLTEAFWTYLTTPTSLDEPTVTRASAILVKQHPYPRLNLPVIPQDEEGVFVLGGYAKFISEQKVYAVTKGFEKYLKDKVFEYKFVGYRMYDSGLNVANLSSAVIADGDVDALLGGGGNIDSNGTGNLSTVIVKMQDGNTVYHSGADSDATRTHITLNNQILTEEFWAYLALDSTKALLALNCDHKYEGGVCKHCGAIKPIETARVLLVGNSYTYYNDNMLAKTLKTLAADARYDITVDELSNGSAKLQYYLNGQYSEAFLNLITTNTYRYIVLQEHSTNPITNKESFLQSVAGLKTLIAQHQPSAEVILYMTWARSPDSTDGFVGGVNNPATVQEMEDKLHAAYLEASTTSGLRMSPVGRAFGKLRTEISIDLYASDKTHPSRAGSYLAALTLFSTIFKENALMVRYIPDDISMEASIKLREAARSAVMTG